MFWKLSTIILLIVVLFGFVSISSGQNMPPIQVEMEVGDLHASYDCYPAVEGTDLQVYFVNPDGKAISIYSCYLVNGVQVFPALNFGSDKFAMATTNNQ